jgi:hypothetical protein
MFPTLMISWGIEPEVADGWHLDHAPVVTYRATLNKIATICYGTGII